MKVFTTENIRNISLLGHRGSGKTTLIESILYVKDYIKRKGDVENGTTVSDFDKEEIRRIFSINTSLIPVEHNNVKLVFMLYAFIFFVASEYFYIKVVSRHNPKPCIGFIISSLIAVTI